MRGAARDWGLVLLGVAVLSWLVDLAGLPSPVLFGSMAAAILYAALGRRPLDVPAPAFTLGQALVGAAIGAVVQPSTLRTFAEDWWSITLVCVATLLASVAAGQGLRLHRGVSAATGTFALIAGGASGVVAAARDLGADERVVAVVQYLRVLVVLVTMPAVTALVFRPDRVGGGTGTGVEQPGWVVGVVFTVVCVGAGLVLGRVARIPAGSLLGPLLVSVLVALSGVADAVAVPGLLVNLGYALIGIQVGLKFTRASLRSIASMLPLALALIVAVVAVSAGFGVLLAQATGVSQLDAYLATTPGGLYAVLATAVDTGSDVTFVLAVQVLRLLVMLFAAPLVARVLARTAPP